MKKICCVGHITHDKIITPRHTDHLSGGTAYYFAHGIARLPNPAFSLVTSVGEDDYKVIDELRAIGTEDETHSGQFHGYFRKCLRRKL